MSDPAGFYGHVPGSVGETFVHYGSPGYARLRAAMDENLRRLKATDLKHYEDQMRLGARVADDLAEDLQHIDPEVLAEVVVVLASKIGGFLSVGAPPATVINIVGIAAEIRAGHLARAP